MTSRAPRRRASSTNGQRCTFELTMLAPQATIRRASTTASGSKPMRACRRSPCSPAAPARGADGAVEQARAERAEEAPVHAAVRRAGPCCPAYEYGRIDCGPCRRDRAAEAVRDRVERLVPGDALEPALALRPDAAQRVQQAVGAVHAVQVLVDLRAQEALREAVVGVAADRRPRGRPRRRPSSRRCPGSRAGRRPSAGGGPRRALRRSFRCWSALRTSPFRW